MSAHDSNHSKGHAAPSDASGALPFAPTLRKLIIILVVGFAVPVIILVVIAHIIATDTAPPVASQPMAAQSLAPVAQASVASAPAAAPAAAATTVADAGKALYDSTCIACHGAGVAGAPKFGDQAAWAPIIAQGLPTLYTRAIHGYTGKRGMMPPKGGSTASDGDVKAAVDYIVEHSKGAGSAVTTAAAGTAPAAPAAAATTVADAGKALYDSTCIACHGAGVAGAPKFGDKAAWAPIIANGLPTLYTRAIHGYTGKRGMMPPKGGSTASDADVKAAVDYMVDHSK